MNHAKYILALAVLTVLSACTTIEGSTEVAFKDETYTPTGSAIPRKKIERDGKQKIVSGEELQRVIDSNSTAVNP
jgi:hypothetical protein